MMLTTRNLPRYLTELNHRGWDYRLVSRWIDGHWYSWIGTYTHEGE